MSIRECEVCAHLVVDNQVPFCPMCLLRSITGATERVLDLPASGGLVEDAHGEDATAWRDLMAALMPWNTWERCVASEHSLRTPSEHGGGLLRCECGSRHAVSAAPKPPTPGG